MVIAMPHSPQPRHDSQVTSDATAAPAADYAGVERNAAQHGRPPGDYLRIGPRLSGALHTTGEASGALLAFRRAGDGPDPEPDAAIVARSQGCTLW
jgi:hypothetical protein